MPTSLETPGIDDIGDSNTYLRLAIGWSIRIIVGMFLVALLNCFLIGAAIQYIQVRIFSNLRHIQWSISFSRANYFYSRHNNKYMNHFYTKIYHWSWLCDHDDEKIIWTLRRLNAAVTIIVMVIWSAFPATITQTLVMNVSVVQVCQIIKFQITSGW